MDTWFKNMPVPVQFGLGLVCLLIAVLLIVAIIRLLRGSGLRMSGARARQARLGIVDAFDLDRQRQLIIVRRDNTEHLIMIGGPNDILIESEIVRVEAARDLRGRERGEASGADRIPAPMGADQGGAISAPRPEEPLLPMPLPEAPAGAATPEPARGPTFPLPPRRPAGPPVPPPPQNRRPAGPPPRLPEGVIRDVPPPPVAPIPGDVPSPAPTSLSPEILPPPPQGEALTPPAPPVAAPGPVAPPLGQTRPPFLKPLPPRPPIRPLTRVTPKPPGAGPQDPPMGTPSSSAPPPGPPPSPPMSAPTMSSPVPPPHPEAAPPAPLAKPADESNDALDSLEEEMAKLLGRG